MVYKFIIICCYRYAYMLRTKRKPTKSHRVIVLTQMALVEMWVVQAQGSNSAYMSIDCIAINYARRCSSTLLNHLPLEEGASIACFLFPFF